MALGADDRTIFKMILNEAGRRLAIDLTLAVTLALVLVTIGARFMASFLYQVSRADPVVWGSTIGLLTLVSIVATLAPARRATRVNPVEALRAE